MWYEGALTGQLSYPPDLHSFEGQKNEKPGSVVSHCWLWLQVIKALLSFCQSSNSPNISPWLISAVSSVRDYTEPWKDQHPAPVFAVHLSIPSSKKPKEIYLDIIFFWPGFCISQQAYRPQLCVSAGHRELAFVALFKGWDFIVVLKWVCGASAPINFICVVPDQLPEHWSTGEWYHQAVICQILLWCTPWMRMGIRRCDRGGLSQRQVCRCYAAS